MFNQIVGDVNFDWWVGVVEDRKDPKKMGRVRVRIFGRHTKDKSEIPTESLPWAIPMLPTTRPSVSGIGESPRLVEGTWVIGFHLDGIMSQEPVILGSILGYSTESPPMSEGFSDPFGKYPISSDLSNSSDRRNEPDINRLARNEKLDETIVKTKSDNRDKNVPVAFGGKWTEPESTASQAEYPMNQVMESESGHIKEVDDTEGNERLHWYHKEGTFEEIHSDGDAVRKNAKDFYSITEEDGHVHIKGDLKITVDGSMLIKVKNNVGVEVDGNIHTKSKKKSIYEGSEVHFNP